MAKSTGPTLVERARKAAAHADWTRAHDLLIEADATTPLRGADLALLADASYASGHLAGTIEAWERAYAHAVAAADDAAAAGAAVRVALHLLLDTALLAPVRGWLKRAERHLEGQPPAAVHAWFAVVRNYERMLAGDLHAAREWARRAIELGTRHDAGAAAIGRLAEARSLILEGDVQHGLAMLDEAAAATVAGELDPIPLGMVYCELVCALQGLTLYDMAEEWTQAMERWRRDHGVGSIHGRCRVHRAEILRLRGAYGDAEVQALRACEELRPYLRREFGWPLTELGHIRLRKGDLSGAEAAFLAAHRSGWDPQPGLALVCLARGDVARAAAYIRDALEKPMPVPSKELPPNTELRRAPLLDAQVDIALAAGDLDRATWAAHELAAVATVFESRALAASAAAADGKVRLRAGDVAGARGRLEAALHAWNEVGAPYEAALARMALAEAHREQGNEHSALLEFRAARAAFERIGAVHQARRAARACGEVEPPATPAEPDAETAWARAPGSVAAAAADVEPSASASNPAVFRRDGDYWTVSFEGRTVRVRDMKGLRYLARLLSSPGRELHVLELAAGESGAMGSASGPGPLQAGMDVVPSAGPQPWDAGHAGELLDARAKDAYRRRLAEIDQDIEESRALGDVQREAQADAEREFLLRELSRAVGLGGRDRRAGSSSERARASVTRAIRSALARIRTYSPALADHLDVAIRTGTHCAYRPDPRLEIRWRVTAHA